MPTRVQRIQASFFSQPVEIPSFRSWLGALLQRKGFPQMVLRMGYTEDPRPTPRRGVDEVLQG